MSTVIHLCIVSDQVPANLIPILKERPSEVWLLVSERMREKARTLERLLEKSGIGAVRKANGLPDFDVVSIRDKALELALDLAQHNDAEIVFNVTGGNKLMTIGLLQVLQDQLDTPLRVLYCDTQHDALEYIAPEPRRQNLGDVLDLASYLAAYDYRVTDARSDDDGWHKQIRVRRRATLWLGRNIHRDPGFLTNLNRAANSAAEAFDRGKLHEARQPLPVPGRPVAREALELLAQPDFNLLDWAPDEQIVTFKSQAAARFVGGGWLEEFAYDAAVGSGLHDVRCGVKVESNDREADNELDVAIVDHNRLFVIECKTARTDGTGERGQDTLHKLDNLASHLGGVFGERWLLSARRLDEAERKRAGLYRIQVVEGESLCELPEMFASIRSHAAGA